MTEPFIKSAVAYILISSHTTSQTHLTAMMKYLALALLLSALVSLSIAQCSRKAMKPGMTHCQDDVDNTWHAVGSSWRNSKCMDCTCDGCCAGYSTPTRFAADCVSVFDPQACEFIVHRRGNPNILCPILGAVGK